MSYLLARGADVISIALGIIIGGSVLGVAGKGAAFVPALDAWLFPVIQIDDITDIYRDSDKACFTLHLRKLRSARPIRYEWHAQAPLSPEIGVAVYLVGPDNKRMAMQRLETHPVGEVWERRYCFDMPGTLSARDDMTMSGKAFHQRHPLWDTETTLPPFTIEAAKG